MVRKLDHEKAVALRMEGKSYNEIAKDLGVWKSSLSGWLKGLRLPLKAVKILEEKTNYPKEKFKAWNKRRHKEAQAENKEILENFTNKIKPVSKYELLLLGAALYWGEGYKNQTRSCGQYASFCNSDPDMVKVFMFFLRNALRVPEEKMRPRIQIHPNISKKAAICFWSKIVNLTEDRFYVYYQISRASKGKRPKNSLPYGTFEIRVSDKRKFFEIMGLIKGLVKQLNSNG
ncbi:MAG: hypothetical protein ABIJ84_01725 [bacterium]